MPWSIGHVVDFPRRLLLLRLLVLPMIDSFLCLLCIWAISSEVPFLCPTKEIILPSGLLVCILVFTLGFTFGCPSGRLAIAEAYYFSFAALADVELVTR
jgi:hypothetical protein